MGSTRTSKSGTTSQRLRFLKATKVRWSWRRVLALALLGFLGFAAYEYLTLPQATPLLKQNPETTALIEQRAAEAQAEGRKPRRKQSWVGLSNIAKPAIDAVLISEDASFYLHEGVDTAELEKALQEAWKERKLGRGASTITQQLAKNLWLSTDRSLLRKAKELVLAHRLEEALPKNRILTLYLNVVEWGSGVYGIEAGAKEHFGVSASRLTPAQGAILAAMLPAPRKRSPSSGSRALKRRSHWIIDQMLAVKRLSAEQAQTAHSEIDKILGGKTATEDPGDEDSE
ncbi:MAG TPA: biosynthetic peptidoglycan transglycosylase [Myxococcaceae bacterium]|jgi:monofunctional biosynthetic peptidoglycan transglycosylase